MSAVLTLSAGRELPALGAPANAGAWRLGWWLSGDDRRWGRLISHAGVPMVLVDRLLDGSLTPVDERAAAIARETEGEVMPGDWELGCGAAWTDRPPARVETR